MQTSEPHLGPPWVRDTVGPHGHLAGPRPEKKIFFSPRKKFIELLEFWLVGSIALIIAAADIAATRL